MRLVSFDPLRTFDLPGVRSIKPEHWFAERDVIAEADWVLFPETWQLNALVYAWRKRVFPSEATYRIGVSKIEMTRAFEALCPACVPTTLVLPSTDRSVERILDEMTLPIVLKEVRSSMGRGVFLVETAAELRRFAEAHDVLYAQERLPIDRDLRVVVVGRRCIGAYWKRAPAGRFHHNVARGGEISYDDIPSEVVARVEWVANELGIDHAGFDVAVVDGHPYLLEMNVRFGDRGLHEAGVRAATHILRYLESCADDEPHRPGGPHPAAA